MRYMSLFSDNMFYLRLYMEEEQIKSVSVSHREPEGDVYLNQVEDHEKVWIDPLDG